MLAKIIEQGVSQKEEMKERSLLSVMDQRATEELKMMAENNARLGALNLK